MTNYVQCCYCGEPMPGRMSYRITRPSPNKFRYLCHECQTQLNEFSQQKVVSLDETPKFKDLLLANQGERIYMKKDVN